ncbi:DUF2004 domain-containing protein [Listeria welshimeri]|nr:DUF2004 domain-containing protein [Listeria welshimeri]MBC1463390.1 DUF2004 domain-containing protein [Listeria welshimeri]MBC1769043.1 DUF2004 domain-containing protein [Listeria welshimeri]MBC2251457.1 DUF2004 domain-containing protein [Listeria welshimeri]
MTQRILTTKLLGKLTYDKENGILTDAVIPLDGKNVTLDFDVFEGITSEVVFQDIVTLTDQIPKLYINAKKTILEQFGENNIISFYFDYHIDNMPNEVLEITQVDTFKKISSKLLVDKLVLSKAWFSLNLDDEIELTFDFTLLPNDSDELLVVRFNRNEEIIDLSHES